MPWTFYDSNGNALRLTGNHALSSHTGATVDSAEIAAGAIDLAHMSVNSINSDQYVDGSIDNAHIADDAINSEHYAAGSIDTAHIANDQITLAKMAGGTDGNIISYDASGDPVAIATGSDGQVLTSTGAGSPPAFEDAGGGGGGGITEADQWRLTSQFTDDVAPIASNLERNDSNGFGLLSTETGTSTGMAESSGIFSFPDTGYWLVTFNSQFYGYAVGVTGAIFVTINADAGSPTWTKVAHSATGGNPLYISYNAGSCSHIIDVTAIADVKVRFHIEESDTNTNTRASTTQNRTFMTFIRLGAT